MLVSIDSHFWHLIFILVLAMENAAPWLWCTCGHRHLIARLVSRMHHRLTVYVSVCYIQYTQILRHKRQHVWVITLQRFVELVFTRREWFAHSAPRELKNMTVATDLMIKWLQLYDTWWRLC